MTTEVAIRLRLVVGTWFQVLFTRLLGVLFTFPSRYLFTIGHGRVFSLARWCWQLPTGFPRSRGTQGHPRGHAPYAYRTFTFYGAAFQTASTSACDPVWGGPTTPVWPKPHRFGLFPVRSPLLRESLLLSFPPGTEMFHFPRFASHAYVFSVG